MTNKFVVMMTIGQVVVFVLMCLFPYSTFGGFSAEECIEEDFYKPYVKVYKKLSGAPEKVMTKPGFLDLYQYTNKIICLNGPMVIYEDVVFSMVDHVHSDIPDDLSNPEESAVHKRDLSNQNSIIPGPCVPGQNGYPPGFSCESNGSGSGIPISEGTTRGPTTPPTTIPNNEPATELTTVTTVTIGPDPETTAIGLEETTPTGSEESPPPPVDPIGPETEVTETAETTTCSTPHPTKSKTLDFYTGAKVEIFRHRCLMLNKLPKEEVLRQREQENPLTYDRVQQIVPSTKKLGVYMLSNDMNDYTTPSLFQFERPNFEYHPVKLGATIRPNVTHSFALIGNAHQHVFCHNVPGKNGKDTEIELYMEQIPSRPQICTYPGGSDPSFDTVFRGEDKNNFTWKPCHVLSDDITTPDPNEGREFKQFAFMPPFGSGISGRTRFSSVEDTGDDDESAGNEIGRSGAGGRSKSVNRCTHALENCTQLPVFEGCKDQNNSNTKTKDACQFLISTMGLDDVPEEEDSDEFKMLKEVLGLIDSIFGKICKKVPRTLSPTISGILMTYLKEGTTLLSRNGTWKFLMGELKTCKTHARPMKFEFDTTMLTMPETESTTIAATIDGDTTMDTDTATATGTTLSADPTLNEATPRDESLVEATNARIDGSINNGEIDPDLMSRRKRSPVKLSNALQKNTAPSRITSLSKVGGESFVRKIRRDVIFRNKLANPKSSGNLPLENADDKYTGAVIERKVRQTATEATTVGPTVAPTEGPTVAPTVGPTGGQTGGPTTSSNTPSNVFVPASLPRPIIEVDDFEEKGDDSGDTAAIPVNVRVLREIEGRSVKTPLFYYQEAAELEYMFNSVIDTHWKVFATVAGYCNKFYKARKSETFPRLYNSYFEDILEPMENIWKSPADNKALEVVISEFRSEMSTRWLDNCMEGSYIVSDSKTYRPPRPLTVRENGEEKTNYFEEIPAEEDFISENARRALHGGLQHEANAQGKNGLHGGDMVKIPSDPGCHWTCDEKGENCHKECGMSDKEIKPKKRTIIHGPNGEKVIVETAISEEENEVVEAPNLGRGIIIKNKGKISDNFHKPKKSIKEKLETFNPLNNKKKDKHHKIKTEVGGRSMTPLDSHQTNPHHNPNQSKKGFMKGKSLAKHHKSQEALKPHFDEISALKNHHVRNKYRKKKNKVVKDSMVRRLKHPKGRERSSESAAHFQTHKTTTEKPATEEHPIKSSLGRAAATRRLSKPPHKRIHHE